MPLLYRAKTTFVLFPLLLAAGWPALRAEENRLMPQPAKLVWGSGRLEIGGAFRVALTGYQEPRLDAAARRAVEALSLQTGIPMNPAPEADPSKATLVIRCAHAGEAVQSMREDESYTLRVSAQGAELSAATPVGILRGLETFRQLVRWDDQGFGAPAVTIEDRPRFPWRGLMLDVSRRWIPFPLILRTLDGMAIAKLNVFHWHLSDDQGFRVESHSFPKLHELGSDGNYYTQAEIRQAVAYASERGIRVVPEFDIPGHTTSWLVGYPELASLPGPYSIDRQLGVRDPALDPTREEVYAFLDAFIGEMAELFPDEYFHIGGDEVNGKHWAASPRIQAFMREHGMKDRGDLQAYFNQRMLPIFQKHGKKLLGWDEILHPELPKDIVVQSWRGQKSLAEAARHGYQGILSTGYYLDLMQSASDHYRVDPLEGETASLTPEEQARILGGEACTWTENIDDQNINSADWPRAAAIAERLWSPQQVKDADSMYRRLELMSRELAWSGLTHRTISRQMLERLAGDADAAPLATLDSALVPINCDIRRQVNHYTSLKPLNRLVDATPPESDVARKFAARVAAWQDHKDEIRQQLTLWRDCGKEVLPLMRRSALLAEAVPVAEDVSVLAAAGLEALDYLESGKAAPRDWRAKQQPLLDRCARPRVELIIAITPAIRRLVEGAQSAN